MKKLLGPLLGLLLVVGVLVGGYYLIRLLPLITTNNEGSAKVVLLHGLGRSEMAMLQLESALTAAGFDVYSFGYPSNDQAPEVLVDMVSEKIDACCSKRRETVHFVGHSLGGLLIRAYLGRQRPPRLGRVVLLGVPNKGSELADAQQYVSLSEALLHLAGPAAKALRTGPEGFAASLPAPDYPVGVIAGTRDNPVSNEWLPVPNDGMVSVASARLEVMTDFMTFGVTHWGLRTEPAVAAQVVEFLRRGEFAHDERQ
jgi:pimeloyl-ACP methyl ester carboxylesterase